MGTWGGAAWDWTSTGSPGRCCWWNCSNWVGAELLLGVLVLAVEVLLLLRELCSSSGLDRPGSAGPKRSAAC